MRKHVEGVDGKTACGIPRPPNGVYPPKDATCTPCRAAHGLTAFRGPQSVGMRPVYQKKRYSRRGPLEDTVDYDGECEVCGNGPVIPETGMCPVCTFGEADALDDYL